MKNSFKIPQYLPLLKIYGVMYVLFSLFVSSAFLNGADSNPIGANGSDVNNTDPSIKAYHERCETIIQGNLTALKSWAATNAGASNLGAPGKISIWTAAAGFSRGKQDKEALSAARLLAASLMASKLNRPFVGGNDGWPAWGRQIHAFVIRILSPPILSDMRPPVTPRTLRHRTENTLLTIFSGLF